MSKEENITPKSLSYRRYTIVNIRHEDRLTPHLCVIVDDDESFQEAAKVPHFQFVITDTDEPVRRGAYVPITVTHGHTYPATEEQLKEAESDSTREDPERYEVELEDGETLTETLFKDLDNVAERILDALSEGADVNSYPERPQSPGNLPSDGNTDDDESEHIRHDLNTYRSEECVDGEWRLEVPTAFIALSHLIYEAYPQEAPAFLIASNKTFKPNKAQGYSYDDFDFIVEYEDYEGERFSDSTAELTRLREGQYIITTSNSDMGNAAGVLLDKIVRIASGDISAVHEASELMEDFARLAKKDGTDGEPQERPRTEDTILHTMLNLLLDLYSGTSTENLFNTLYESSVLDGYEDTVDDLEEQTDIINNMIEVEKLFESEGLHNLFSDFSIQYESPKIPSDAREADFAGFYSTPLTPGAFPESMKALADTLDFPFIYENSILDNEAMDDITVTAENAGPLFLSMVIALAVRYERLKEIQDYGLPLIPFNIFLKVFQDVYESNYISDIIMFSVVNIPVNGTALIRELAANHMPSEKQERLMSVQSIVPGSTMPLILTFPATILLHYLNHMIFDDGLDLQKLSDSLYENNPLREYVESLAESLENIQESSPFGKDACPELVQAVDLVVSTDMSSAEIADAVVDLMVNTAKLSVTSHTDFTPGTPEWQDYLAGFYQTLIQK